MQYSTFCYQSNMLLFFFTLLGEVYVIDKEERHRILVACHQDLTSGHMGTKITLSRITERFIWPGVIKDVGHMGTC